MRGDILVIQAHHREAAREIAPRILRVTEDRGGRVSIGVAGESGSGKSELAQALHEVLAAHECQSLILQQDDYFLYPPKQNHARRIDDIAWVGPQEVDLERLARDVAQLVRNGGPVEKPLVHYKDDCIESERVDATDCRVILVEGTYVSLLDTLDLRIFIEQDYHQTLEARRVRNREAFDPFIERVLEIEHQIIREHERLADVVVEEDYAIREVVPESR